MPNDKFNFTEWNQRWDDAFIRSMGLGTGDYVSPYDAVVRERQLAKLRREHPKLKALPVDYFVWGLGEPENRATTKIGGIPYLPQSIKWPHQEPGEPHQFFAQINFTDSRDFIRKTPNDILLIFSSDEPCLLEDFVFIWVADDPSQPLIKPAAAKKFTAKFCENNRWSLPGEDLDIQTPLFAQIFRTTEVEFDDAPDPVDETTCHLLSGSVCSCKIGGLGHSQNPSQIFRLESLGLQSDRPQPWLNREAPYTTQDFGGKDGIGGHYKTFFEFGDVGSIKFFLDVSGQISIDCHSY